MPEGYCVKERKKVEIQNPQQVTMKNGRPAIQGTCPDCGTKIFKIGKLAAESASTSGFCIICSTREGCAAKSREARAGQKFATRRRSESGE